jgi:hypothetical protein
MFMIHGGVYTDTTFEVLDVNTYECYGPFDTYEEALNAWRGKMGRMIDTCTHRLFIQRV